MASVGAFLGGAIGYASDGFIGVMVGVFFGTILFTIIAMIGKGKMGTLPPEVRIAGDEPPRFTQLPARQPDQAAQRLRRLEALKADGTISAAEYAERRANIISSL